jgi:SHS2 domain-containing protein
MKNQFEFLEHEADIKIKVKGRTLQEIFENSALALTEYISEGEEIKNKKVKTLEVKGQDTESLFYNFIDELIYILDAENFIANKCSVFLRGNNLKADIYGDDTSNYTNLKHVKAATYSEMSIKKIKDSWEAIFVIDV